ncbi:MAG: NHLP family bacteriocin export ABC transporter peptidase/permease/ATPase subunit [Synergistaceae bacterium]|nr:NHLP family bacteriocin export ABC transporter peptidase/permease/ATPase subunit [Synergistaceae bacterium]
MKKISKTPMIMQLEAVECGAACLTMIAAYYGKWIPLEKVRKDCGVSRDGMKASNIIKVAINYGFEAKGFRYDNPEILKNNCEYPCIIHWNFNHFVVLNGFTNKYAVINDPAEGVIKVSLEEFDKSFTGICLTFKPGKDFKPEGAPKSIFSFVKKRLKGASSALIFTAAASIIISLFNAINPMMSKIFIDRILSDSNGEWLYSFLAILACLGVLQLSAIFVNTVTSLKINGKLSVIGNASYMWKILRLPMEFFSQRRVGEIYMRQSANALVAETLINTLAPLLLNIFMMIFYITVMFKYSVILSSIGILSIALNALLSYIISQKRVNTIRVQMKDAGEFYSSTISGIKMIETIKANGAENGFFQKWAGYQAAANSSTEKLIKIMANFGCLPEFIFSVNNVLIISIGVYLAMNGRFTLGMILTFQGLLTAFMLPAITTIEAGQTIQEMRTNMERIEDVMEYPDDENCKIKETSQEHENEYKKLSGNVELKNVTFGYSRIEEPLIRDFSMTVEQGKSVALVGATGCGKSTISKLISGLYTQWEGEILFDGKKISEIDRNVFTGSVAVVDQDIILFEDTIAANIKMWDNSIEDFEMILAARDAQLHSDIMEREGGYSCKLSDGGRDLSGGQRQRLEIARVLAQDPTIVILDEATSALDSKTEFEVVKAIKDRGITTIVIAHRLSTIRDCDEIIVINKGVIAERGTHDELMSKNGIYKSLVTNE